MSRKWKRGLVVGLVVLLALAGGFVLWLQRDRVAGPPAAGDDVAATPTRDEPDATPPVEPAGTLVYLELGAVKERDLATGEETELGHVPDYNVWAARGSKWIGHVVIETPEGHPAPVLYLLDPDADERLRVDHGITPAFSPDGTSLAFARPQRPRTCDADRCRGDVEIVVVDPTERENAEVVLEAGPWRLIGWAGDRLLVGSADEPSETLTVTPDRDTTTTPDGDKTTLDLPWRRVWGASPDGSWMLLHGRSGAGFQGLVDGRLAGAEVPIAGLDEPSFGTGAWSHDSSMVAVATPSEEAHFDEVLVALSPESPAPNVLWPEGGFLERVVWSPDDAAVVFGMPVGRAKTFYCRVEAPACTDVMDWEGGVVLLRLE